MSSQKNQKKTKTETTAPTVNYFKFLGTAGARFVMAKQLRASGGIYLELLGQKIALDPGPGALVRMTRSRPPIDPTEIGAVILSHKHIDHSNDVNILLDAMTAGGLKKGGVLLAPEECLDGPDAVVLRYLRGYLDRIEILKPEKTYQLGALTIRTSCRHEHEAETYGLKFYLPGLVLGFMVDTKYFPGLLPSYRDVDILVMNVLRAKEAEGDYLKHLTVTEAREIIKELKPSRVYLTHFGLTMLQADPRQLAEKMSGETGVEVLAAYDGLTVALGPRPE
ncbi:MAG: MBL fold metallo-hydrolase [Candidatus Saccharicenans sp.]|nr:MBL fold metallo-hydrolase [Candidatus Saccharicenans sp.]